MVFDSACIVLILILYTVSCLVLLLVVVYIIKLYLNFEDYYILKYEVSFGNLYRIEKAQVFKTFINHTIRRYYIIANNSRQCWQ